MPQTNKYPSKTQIPPLAEYFCFNHMGYNKLCYQAITFLKYENFKRKLCP